MSGEPVWIDSHNHHYLTSLSVLSDLSQRGLSGLVEASWIPVRPSSWSTLEDLFRWLTEVERQRLSRIGVRLMVALGVHPRCIPPGFSSNVKRLEGWLEMNGVVALGEVGIDSGSEEEREAFREQLRVARALDRPAIVHTPRMRKAEIARLELQIIREVGFPEELAVIDHFNAELLNELPKGRYMVGLSLQPGKLSVGEAVELVYRLEPERILINSDSSTEPSEPSWGLELLRRLSERDGELARMAGWKNAQRFFGL
nr:TatD-related deoxyribonuclease (DNase) [uncultured archaeon]